MARRGRPDPLQLVLEDVRSDSFAPVYLLHGRESYLLRRAQKAIMEAVSAKGPKAFNVQVFPGKADPQRVVESCRTLPMMSTLRLVVVDGVDALNAESQAAYVPYLTKPVDSAVLIFVAGKVDARRKFAKACAKAGRSLEFRTLYERDCLRFIETEVGRMGKRMDPSAARLLFELVGNNLGNLANELTKLSLFVAERPRIEVDDIGQVVSDVKLSTVFELLESLGRREVEPTLLGLHRVFSSGGEPLMVTAMLARHLRQLLRAHEARSRGMSESDICRAAGMSPNLGFKLMPQLKGLSPAQIERAIGQVSELDQKLKGGWKRSEQPILVERAILGILAPRSRGGGGRPGRR